MEKSSIVFGGGGYTTPSRVFAHYRIYRRQTSIQVLGDANYCKQAHKGGMQTLGGKDYCKNTGLVIKAFITCWEVGFNQHSLIWDVQFLGSSLHPPTRSD